MNFRVLDIVIISAKDLKQVNPFFKMDVFTLASVQGYNNNLYNSLQKTPIDKDGGSNPNWNFPMKFFIDVVAAENNCLTLVIKLKADGSFGDKDIGEVHVPVKELLDKYVASNDEMHAASYNVRTTRAGKFKGELNFSFKFGDAVAAAPADGGFPLPQMQPQEETSMGKKFAKKLGAILCGFVKIAAVADIIFDNIWGCSLMYKILSFISLLRISVFVLINWKLILSVVLFMIFLISFDF